MYFYTSIIINLIICLYVAAQGTLQPQILADEKFVSLGNNIKTDIDGYLHLDDKGILRSFDNNNKVIDYKLLSAEDFTLINRKYSPETEKDRAAFWENNISSIEENEIWNPSEHMMAAILSGRSMSESESSNSKSEKPNLLALNVHEKIHGVLIVLVKQDQLGVGIVHSDLASIARVLVISSTS
ncbi:predicted protein [Histoplasma capsulatum G186AR]|uniref:Uncharacterized protein n=1 Tax=Ajellomyces capsulatus (strain G186AR / H82 / ATCC MYA-2454 / RMSCC 2432) TaxID=447093 RepID=C0NRH2_AJECG|nr:uncharacterized protein HCBG_05602 [Histoplasma capsulatum G186AR]EEH06286.1 predicted protein [Histoplasma capsulatum G186AR]